jgi:hypothetical protein
MCKSPKIPTINSSEDAILLTKDFVDDERSETGMKAITTVAGVLLSSTNKLDRTIVNLILPVSCAVGCRRRFLALELF